MTHPMAVASCNIEMEHLMTDSNRSIATYAITTLLKTGSESSVERLLKQIGTFMSDIAGAQPATSLCARLGPPRSGVPADERPVSPASRGACCSCDVSDQ